MLVASTLASKLVRFEGLFASVALLARVPFEGADIVSFEGLLASVVVLLARVPFEDTVKLEPELMGLAVGNAEGEAVVAFFTGQIP